MLHTLPTISKQDAVRKILSSKGRMFTVVWTTQAGKQRKLNGRYTTPKSSPKRLQQDKIYGYLTIDAYDNKTGLKIHRRVDCRTISALSIDKTKYVVN